MNLQIKNYCSPRIPAFKFDNERFDKMCQVIGTGAQMTEWPT